MDLLLDGRWVRFPHTVLAVLDAFARPRTIDDAVAALGGRAAGRQDWIDLTRTILVLQRSGFLVEDGPRASTAARGFATAHAHIALLNDRPRTEAMLDAIAEVVRPGDVVVDIGSGCGILAVAAARAGAAQVYAIESTAAAAATRALADGNGVGDRVTVVDGWSSQVTLPRAANVLVTEIAGNEPFGAQLLEVVIDARQRLLAAGAKLIPSRLRLFAQPVWIPEPDLGRLAFTADAARRWHEWYGLDFSSFGPALLLPDVIHVDGDVTATWDRFGEPLLLADIDLGRIAQPHVAATVVAHAPAAGRVNAVIGYTEMDLSPSITRSSSPYVPDRGARWTTPVWMCAEPVPVVVGESYAVSVAYPGRTGRTTISIARHA